MNELTYSVRLSLRDGARSVTRIIQSCASFAGSRGVTPVTPHCHPLNLYCHTVLRVRRGLTRGDTRVTPAVAAVTVPACQGDVLQEEGVTRNCILTQPKAIRQPAILTQGGIS